MSGIFGIGMLDGSNINNAVLKNVTKAMFTCLQTLKFGDCSAGIVVSKSKDIHVLKHNVSPLEFVELPEFISYIIDNVNSYNGNPLNSIMGVAGTKMYNALNASNNPLYIQPMRTNDIVGVHDGVINNSSEIDRKFLNVAGYKRVTKTDSEAIFSVINFNSLNNSGKLRMDSPTTQAILDTTRILKGSYACGILDIKTPNNMWLIRKDKPLAIAYFKNEGIVIWASDYRAIRTAIEYTDFSEPIMLNLPNSGGICFNFEYNNYYRFGVGDNISKSV